MLSLMYFAENTVCFRECVFVGNPLNLRLYLKHRLFCWAIKCFFVPAQTVFARRFGSGVFEALL